VGKICGERWTFCGHLMDSQGMENEGIQGGNSSPYIILSHPIPFHWWKY
jgi:hypothetical protein